MSGTHRKIISYCLLGVILSAFGCVTKAVQTEKLLASNHLPAYFKIENVPFIDQTVGYCGPATLTMAMQFAGYAVSADEIANQVYTAGLNGSLQSDLIGAARRHGLLAIPIKNLPELLQEISAGHPVIIFENLSLKWLPRWHYALVFGYDLNKQEIIMHSGHDANFHWDMSKFERSWMLGEYWGLVVLSPTHLSASADELAHVTAVGGLENAKKITEAEISYRKILEKWPTSLVGLIGLANLVFKHGKKIESVQLLKRAVAAHPNSKAAAHNLAIAQASLKK